MRLRLLFYINSLGGGGAERVMTQLASRFAEQGDEVMLVTSFRLAGEYPLSDKVARESIEDEELQQSRFRRNLSRIITLRKLCVAFEPDTVVSFMREPNFRLLVATLGLPCRKVVSVRNDPAREYAGALGAFVGKALMPCLADCCVFQTQEASNWFPKMLRDKSVVIPNEIAPEFFELERSGKDEYWVALGRLTEQKNYPMMLEAFRSVVDEHPVEHLRIYGAGPLCDDIQSMIEALNLADNVKL